jgi:hypothetical protein
MTGDLDQQYAETQGNLQDAINEALPSAPGAADVEFPSNASGTLLAQIESF